MGIRGPCLQPAVGWPRGLRGGSSKVVAPQPPEGDSKPRGPPLTSDLKSLRYEAIKTHRHVQRDAVRQYRKQDEGQSCCRRLCSRRSSTGHWVDSQQAQVLFSIAIVCNSLLLAFHAYAEAIIFTDDRRKLNIYVFLGMELCFVLLFFFELILRCRAAAAFLNPWNQYDGFVILFFSVDVCVLIFADNATGIHDVFLHLMWTLQVFRLGRFIQELRLIIKGIFSAMQAVLWSLCLLLLIIYFFALLASTFVGRTFPGDQLAEDLFGTMPDAMLTLFAFATIEDVSGSVRHFMHDGGVPGGVVAVVSVGFTLFTNLALLNLVTAVMVDSMIDILPKKHSEKLAQERARTVRALEGIFLKMDGDGDRKLSLQEFQGGATRDKDVQNELNSLQISAFDVKELFTLIDFDDKGFISVDEFIEGLMRMAPGPASKKELLGVQNDLHKMWNMLAAGQERLMDSLEAGLQKLLASTEARLGEQLGTVERRVEESCAHSEQLLEDRFKALMDQILESQCRITGLVEARDAAQSAPLARIERTLVGLPAVLVQRHCESFDGYNNTLESHEQRILEAFRAHLEAFRALLPPPSTPLGPELSRISRLVEELQSGQRQFLEAVAAPRGNEAASRSSEPKPVLVRWRAPPPLQIACFASSADAGPETEPHLMPPTPAIRSLRTTPLESPAGVGAAPVAPAPPAEASALRGCQPAVERAQGVAPAAAAPPNPLMQPQSWLPAPATVQELQAQLQTTRARLVGVQQWVRQQGWAGVPFDKLVLYLDRLGVELSIPEQDTLRRCLQRPSEGSPG